MIIAVIAANGRLGRIFAEAALKAGHTVRAGVHSGGSFAANPRLSVVQCDATNPNDLNSLITGADVVVSCLGHIKASKPDVQTVATRAIVTAMAAAGVARYVDITGTGVRFAGDQVSLVDRFLNFGVGLLDPARVKDGIDHQEVLKASKLEWTTVRVLKLQNIAASPFSLTPNGPTKWVVGRSEAAQAMLEVIDTHTFIRQAPIISRA